MFTCGIKVVPISDHSGLGEQGRRHAQVGRMGFHFRDFRMVLLAWNHCSQRALVSQGSGVASAGPSRMSWIYIGHT